MNEEVNKNLLTSDDVDKLVEIAKESKPEEVVKMEESIRKVNEEGIDESDYEKEIRNISIENSYAELLGVNPEDLPDTEANVFDIARPDFKPNEEDVKNRIKENAELFELDEVQMLDFIDIITKYRANKDIPNLYAKMPSKVRSIIANLAASEGVSPTQYNTMAKLFLDNMISSAELDEAFVDLEKSLDKALQLPSITDMYSEHTRSVMNERIPEIIEKIKDTEPENAKVLENIKAAFEEAYKLEFMKFYYTKNKRIRKAMREKVNKPISFCEEFNRVNAKSRFKVPDCASICPALAKVLIKESENSLVEEGSRVDLMNITPEDVSRFIILFCKSFEFADAEDLIEATRMYYSVKNLKMLGLTNEAKTDFAAELINNICDIIEFIRREENKYASMPRKGKRKH